MEQPPWMYRIAEKYRVPLHEIDCWRIDDLLDEAEVIHYLHDLDNPPIAPASKR